MEAGYMYHTNQRTPLQQKYEYCTKGRIGENAVIAGASPSWPTPAKCLLLKIIARRLGAYFEADGKLQKEEQ